MKKKAQNWWLMLLKGIILILLAFYVFGHPVESLLGLAVFIGVALLLTGIFQIIGSLMVRDVDDNWGWRLAEGIIDVIFALVLISNPGITAAVFPFIVGFWMIVYGVMIFSSSFQLKKEGDRNWWLSLLGGILTVLLGWFVMTDLFAGSFAITVWIGIGLLMLGVVNIVVSLHLKNLKAELSGAEM